MTIKLRFTNEGLNQFMGNAQKERVRNRRENDAKHKHKPKGPDFY